jgi:hypothetical protein
VPDVSGVLLMRTLMVADGKSTSKGKMTTYRVPTHFGPGHDLDRPEFRSQDDILRFIAKSAGVSVDTVKRARANREKRATPTGNRSLDALREAIERNLDSTPRKAPAAPATRPAVSAETARARRFVGDLG